MTTGTWQDTADSRTRRLAVPASFLSNPVGGFEDPWQGYPGGNPIPMILSPNVSFPTAGVYTILPRDLKKPYVNTWNLNIQKQIGTDWLVSGSYLGSNVIHMTYRHEGNPAVYMPGASCVIAGRTYSARVHRPPIRTSGACCICRIRVRDSTTAPFSWLDDYSIRGTITA